jgi:hypothetical protein
MGTALHTALQRTTGACVLPTLWIQPCARRSQRDLPVHAYYPSFGQSLAHGVPDRNYRNMHTVHASAMRTTSRKGTPEQAYETVLVRVTLTASQEVHRSSPANQIEWSRLCPQRSQNETTRASTRTTSGVGCAHGSPTGGHLNKQTYYDVESAVLSAVPQGGHRSKQTYHQVESAVLRRSREGTPEQANVPPRGVDCVLGGPTGGHPNKRPHTTRYTVNTGVSSVTFLNKHSPIYLH